MSETSNLKPKANFFEQFLTHKKIDEERNRLENSQSKMNLN